MTSYSEVVMEPGIEYNVIISYLQSPNNFYVRLLSYNEKFMTLMASISALYKLVDHYTGDLSPGATIVARYPLDGKLYRATVISVEPNAKYVVQYVDVGNRREVNITDIWQMDKSLITIPRMAIHCSLIGIKERDGNWESNPQMTECFDALIFRCLAVNCLRLPYKVSLWGDNDDVDIKATLIERGLGRGVPENLEGKAKHILYITCFISLIRHLISDFD